MCMCIRVCVYVYTCMGVYACWRAHATHLPSPKTKPDLLFDGGEKKEAVGWVNG
jgi:hypothetical protein